MKAFYEQLKQSLDENGLSFVELLIVMSLMGFTAISFMQLNQSQEKAFKSRISKMESYELADEVQELLSNSTNCTDSLNGMAYDTPNTGMSLVKNGVNRYTTGNQFGDSRLTISSYEIITAGVPAGEGILRVTFTGGNAINNRQFTRNIRLLINDNLNPIGGANDCRSIGAGGGGGGGGGGDGLTEDDACSLVGGTIVNGKCNIAPTLQDSGNSDCTGANAGEFTYKGASDEDYGRRLYVCDGSVWQKITTTPACSASGACGDGFDETNPGILCKRCP